MLIAPLKKMWLSSTTNFSRINSHRDNFLTIFFTELKKLSKECEFSDLQNSLIRDMIVIGITDNHLRQRLLREPDLTLDSAIKLGYAYEETKNHVLELLRDFTQNPEIDKISKLRKPYRFRKRNPNPDVIMKWKFCSGTHNKGSCPAYSKICNNWGNKGYFAKCCTRKKGIHSLNQECSDNTAEDDLPRDYDFFFLLGLSMFKIKIQAIAVI